MAHRIPRSIRLLTQYGADALKGAKIGGRYLGPMVSRRVAADVRKQSLKEGTFGSFTPFVGGWDPSWDEPRKFYLIKPLKGHKRDRTREERATKIDKAMAQMPEKINKYYQEMKDRKPKKDIVYLFKKLSSKANKRGGGAPPSK